jgi:membrane-bound metal-dependent hydrolase YbcI (DUF457 family)
LPSPLGHSAAALALHLITSPADALKSRVRIGVLVGAAVAPDLDLLLRFVDGRNHHQAESHSMGCALLAGLAAWALARLRGWPRPGALGVLAVAGWLSHVVLDYLGRDTNPPIGIMALWPLSHGYYKCPWPLFMDIGRTLTREAVFHNALAVAWEMALLGPVILLLWRLRAPSTR